MIGHSIQVVVNPLGGRGGLVIHDFLQTKGVREHLTDHWSLSPRELTSWPLVTWCRSGLSSLLSMSLTQNRIKSISLLSLLKFEWVMQKCKEMELIILFKK